jgi:hypothetical protein
MKGTFLPPIEVVDVSLGLVLFCPNIELSIEDILFYLFYLLSAANGNKNIDIEKTMKPNSFHKNSKTLQVKNLSPHKISFLFLTNAP